ncbi:hypothetical protein [Burkholderia sp. TSV86]|uniref:hypothetical protein n=1 Tax=Burkholderia sp. TSV86 TaxID=1385594 RepID=UPI000A514556|nr:hypothetical protein [Burkholderia sp. TSV86]
MSERERQAEKPVEKPIRRLGSKGAIRMCRPESECVRSTRGASAPPETRRERRSGALGLKRAARPIDGQPI